VSDSWQSFCVITLEQIARAGARAINTDVGSHTLKISLWLTFGFDDCEQSIHQPLKPAHGCSAAVEKWHLHAENIESVLQQHSFITVKTFVIFSVCILLLMNCVYLLPVQCIYFMTWNVIGTNISNWSLLMGTLQRVEQRLDNLHTGHRSWRSSTPSVKVYRVATMSALWSAFSQRQQHVVPSRPAHGQTKPIKCQRHLGVDVDAKWHGEGHWPLWCSIACPCNMCFPGFNGSHYNAGLCISDILNCWRAECYAFQMSSQKCD